MIYDDNIHYAPDGAAAGLATIEPDTAGATKETPPVVDGQQAQAPANAGDSGVQTPAYPGYVGQFNKAEQEDFKRQIAANPELVKKLPPNIAELYRSWAAHDATLANALIIPQKDAPKDSWDQFYTKLGRPESADKYALEKPQLPSGMTYSEGQEKWLRGLSYALGLTQFQAKALWDESNKAQIAAAETIAKARTAQAAAVMEKLKTTWGDKFTENWDHMGAAWKQFGNPQLLEKLKAYGMDNDPDMLEFFVKLYQKIGPPKFQTPSGEGGNGSTGRPAFNFGDVNKYARK